MNEFLANVLSNPTVLLYIRYIGIVLFVVSILLGIMEYHTRKLTDKTLKDMNEYLREQENGDWK